MADKGAYTRGPIQGGRIGASRSRSPIVSDKRLFYLQNHDITVDLALPSRAGSRSAFMLTSRYFKNQIFSTL